VAAFGGWVGGFSGCVVVFELLLARAPGRFALLAAVVLAVLPGNARAAASAKMPVKATLAAASQRLSR
jgi:hypothetical protein